MKARRHNAEILFAKADQQMEAGNLAAAIRLLIKSAKLGNHAAQVNLGYAYDVGKGVRSNRSKALYWYKRAFRAGERTAAANIGTLYRYEGNLTRALHWFHRAVDLRDADANLEIAKILVQRGHQGSAVKYLRRVLNAPSSDVTAGAKQQAKILLKKLKDSS